MIKNGAILTTSVKDILECYPQFKNRLRKNITKNKNICVKIKEEYKKIYNILQKEECYIDEIIIKTGLDLKDALILLTNMELEEIIHQEADGKYKIRGG